MCFCGKFQGEGGGPTDEQEVPGVRNISAYLGERSSELAPDSFDIIFSISVVEHVGGQEALDAFHGDQLRILKPGGIFMHAIDIYLEDDPAPHHVLSACRCLSLAASSVHSRLLALGN